MTNTSSEVVLHGSKRGDSEAGFRQQNQIIHCISNQQNGILYPLNYLAGLGGCTIVVVGDRGHQSARVQLDPHLHLTATEPSY